MRKLTYAEFLCAKIFSRICEKSIDNVNMSSSLFLKRIMNGEFMKQFINFSYLFTTSDDIDLLEEINDKYKKDISNKNNIVLYSNNEMHWIGYIYLSMCYLYELNPRTVYKLFPSNEIRKYYFIYHTFDIEEAVERMMDNIGYKKKTKTEIGLEVLEKLIKD